MTNDKITDIRPSLILAGLFIAVVLAALLGAATNGYVLELVKNAQAFLTGIAAIAAALIAYDAQSSNAREARRKDDLDRLQTRATHYLKMFAEIDASSHQRLALCKTALAHIGAPSKQQCKDLYNTLNSVSGACILSAFENVGIFDQEIRTSIAKAALSQHYRVEDMRFVSEAMQTEDQAKRVSIFRTAAKGIWLREQSIIQLSEALDQELHMLGVDPSELFFDQRDELKEQLDKLSVAFSDLDDKR